MDIVPTVFWINQVPASGWGLSFGSWPSWQGVDGVDARSKLRRSVSPSPLLNSFYVALPFNDLCFPDLARKWMPAGWYKAPVPGQKVASCCKDRWVEIKNGQGRLCFAQWKDVGPLRFDDAEYVFGPKRPASKAGLDVSPAVAQYLGIDRHGAAHVAWRFVDAADVRPGRWLKYDDLAIISTHH